ncbi:MAG TPA: hypothetical protein VHN98_02285, partial [Acidimicrobiales bacterium]|nr:hypothetical protein [Acidimicrobiales bacterium]
MTGAWRREFRVATRIHAGRVQAWNALLDDPTRMFGAAARAATRRLMSSTGSVLLDASGPARVTIEVGGPTSCPVCDRIPIRLTAPGSVVPAADAIVELRDDGPRTALVLDGTYELSMATAGAWGAGGGSEGVALAALQALAA